VAELTKKFTCLVLTLAELTSEIHQNFGRLGHKKCEKKTWPSCPGRVGFGRIDCTPHTYTNPGITYEIFSTHILDYQRWDGRLLCLECDFESFGRLLNDCSGRIHINAFVNRVVVFSGQMSLDDRC